MAFCYNGIANQRKEHTLVRPVKGESFTDLKQFLWDSIHVSQDMVKAVQNCKIKDSALAKEVIKLERENIKRTYAELKELQQWWNKEGKENAKKRLLEKKTST